MPAKRKPAKVKTISGRKGYYAYISREEPNVKLEGDTQEDAQASLARLLKDRQANDGGGLSKKVGAATLAYYANEEITFSSNSNAKRMFQDVSSDLTKRIIPFLEERGINYPQQLKRDDVEAYVNARRDGTISRKGKGVSAARVNREINSFRRLVARSVRGEGLDKEMLTAFRTARNGGLLLKQPKPQKIKRFLSRAELDQILAVIDKRWLPLARSLAGTGIRIEEAWHISAEDVKDKSLVVSAKPPGWCDLIKCCPHGWQPKGYQAREIPITIGTREALNAFVDGRDMLPRHHKNIGSAMRSACDEAEILVATPHDLRRSWATWLFDSGVPIAKVSRLLGHQQLITTLDYLGISLEDNKIDSLPI